MLLQSGKFYKVQLYSYLRMRQKTWEEGSIEGRVKLLAGMSKRVRTQMKEEEKVHASRREELLGSKRLKEVVYGFKMSSILNEDQAIVVLSALGQMKYAERKDQYNIYEKELWDESFAELRWPQHYTDWVDSIKISFSEHSPKADLRVHFWRSAQEIESNPEKSAQEAQELYHHLEQLLRERL